MLDSLLICTVSTNSHTCDTIAYTASEVLGNELNMKAVGFIRKPLHILTFAIKNNVTSNLTQ